MLVRFLLVQEIRLNTDNHSNNQLIKSCKDLMIRQYLSKQIKKEKNLNNYNKMIRKLFHNHQFQLLAVKHLKI